MITERLPRMYDELASWFHLITAQADYAEEAGVYARLLREGCQGPADTLPELIFGGGNNVSHYKRHFNATLVDRAPRMLEVSRTVNPECEHVQGVADAAQGHDTGPADGVPDPAAAGSQGGAGLGCSRSASPPSGAAPTLGPPRSSPPAGTGAPRTVGPSPWQVWPS